MRARLAKELPFIATEEVLMRATRAGGDRQALHERDPPPQPRRARERCWRGAGPNDLFERLEADPALRRR